MKINGVNYLKGPHLYSYQSSICIDLDIEALEYQPSNSFLGFTDSLLISMPGLSQICSMQYEGGRGTWMARILEHMTMEIQQAAGIEVKSSKTIRTNAPGVYHVFYDYKEPKSGLYAFKAAMEITNRLIDEQKAVEVNDYIEETARLYHTYKLDPSTDAIYCAAYNALIPVERIGNGNKLRLGIGSKQKYVQGTISSQTTNIAVENSSNKQLTKDILKTAGLPVPEGIFVNTMEEIFRGADCIGFPLVITPLGGHLGKGTITNIKNREELYNVINCQDQHVNTYVLEPHYAGINYRLLIVDGKMTAASKRLAPFVIGNDVNTIAQLIIEENKNPLRGEENDKQISKIPLDHTISCYLEKNDLSLQSIPPLGQVIQVTGDADLVTGGKAIDVTNQVHPDFEQLGITAAKAIGLDIAGVEIICQNISQPLDYKATAIIEINSNPDIRMHHYPAEGIPRDAGKAIVDYLFANRQEAAIPVIAVTGTNGDTLTTRLLKYFLEKEGVTVGIADDDGILIGNLGLKQAGDNGLDNAHRLLENPLVDVAVIDTTLENILSEGLPFRYCNVGIVSSTTRDETKTVEDFLKVKSLIPEVVIESGYCVLNANDQFVEKLSQASDAEIIYISVTEENLYIDQAISSGGTAWFVDHENWLIYTEQRTHRRFLALEDIPITQRATQQTIEYVLQALAAAQSQGVSLEELRQKLLSFKLNLQFATDHAHSKEFKGKLGLVDTANHPADLKSVYQLIEYPMEAKTLETPKKERSKKVTL